MTATTKRTVVLLAAILLLAARTAPANALSLTEPSASAAAIALPPLPEWPIIGPLLVRLGVIDEAVTPAPVPDPDLPEYRISTVDDLQQLNGIQAGVRIRVITSEADANRMAQDLLAQQVGDGATLWVDFAPNEATVDATADASLIERAGVDLPAIVRGSLRAITTFGASGVNCRPSVDVGSLKVNGWSIGLRAIAQRMADERIAEVWPSEICVERILLMDDEAAVEGYLVP